jgi:diadenosine tetraphosphatase ApaH/serine/threonine PP2A family protein phosphatase
MLVLLVSDIHGNQTAFEAVLAAQPSFDALWNLGDTVGYGPRPRECLDLVVGHGADPSLAGNHDLAAVGTLDLAEFNPVARRAAQWTGAQLGAEHRAYLLARPVMTTASGYTLAHGSPRAPVWEYVTTAAVATANFAYFDTRVCFIGHTHLATSALLEEGAMQAHLRPLRDGDILDLDAGRYLINPGSVGQPRDRDPRAAYALLDTDQGTVTAHRVPYDIPETQRQMALAGLPGILITRLSLGM